MLSTEEIIGIIVGVVLLCFIFASVIVAIYYISTNNANISKTVTDNTIYLLPNSEFEQETLLEDDTVDLGLSGEEEDEVTLLPEDAYLLVDDEQDININDNLIYNNESDIFIFNQDETTTNQEENTTSNQDETFVFNEEEF